MGPVSKRRCSSWSAVLPAVVAAFAGNAVAQQRAPSDDELHSMYCVEVLRAQITLQQHMISASSDAAGAAQPEQRAQWIDTSAELLQRLTKLQGVLSDLQAYMLPRIPTLDALALAAAIRQADSDVEQSRTASGCAGECDDPTHAQPQPPRPQPASWSGASLLTRLSGCENPTWIAL
jgi:hypothetical protein